MPDRPPSPPPPGLSRRSLLRLAAAGLVGGPRPLGATVPAAPAETHPPRLTLPDATANGDRVPITVEAGPTLSPEHGRLALEVVNPRDPVPVKGVFQFTPASGRAWVAFQARLDEGPSSVVATTDCSRHGRFSVRAPVTVTAGGGGCAGGAPPAAALARAVGPPVIRIPALLADGVLEAGQIIKIQVKTRHPSRTGLAFREGRWVAVSEPFHLTALEVAYGEEPVSRFVLGAALSDNPLITFMLRVPREDTVRVTLTNTRGQRFEARHPIRFA